MNCTNRTKPETAYTARLCWWRARNCFVQGEDRLVAAVGVDKIVIVDTGDAVLVADRDRAQDVKEVVNQLSDLKHEAAEFHKTVYPAVGQFFDPRGR